MSGTGRVAVLGAGIAGLTAATELRRNGPFPREVVAQKLGISRSGLARGGITEALDAEQIGALIADPPAWLGRERGIYREVIAEKERLKAASPDR